MKFSFEMILSDVNTLLNHVNECIEDRDTNSHQYILDQYSHIVSATPYSWYFCAGIEPDVMQTIPYSAIKNVLDILKGRLEIALAHRIFTSEAEFDEIRPRIIEEINKATHSINIAVAWLSDPEIIQALIMRAEEGVFLRIIVYNDAPNQSSIEMLKGYQNITLYAVAGFGEGVKTLCTINSQYSMIL